MNNCVCYRILTLSTVSDLAPNATLPPDGLICFNKWLAITLFPYLEAWAVIICPFSTPTYSSAGKARTRRNVRNSKKKQQKNILGGRGQGDCDSSAFPYPLPRIRSWKKPFFFNFQFLANISTSCFYLYIFTTHLYCEKMRNMFGIGVGICRNTQPTVRKEKQTSHEI